MCFSISSIILLARFVFVSVVCVRLVIITQFVLISLLWIRGLWQWRLWRWKRRYWRWCGSDAIRAFMRWRRYMRRCCSHLWCMATIVYKVINIIIWVTAIFAISIMCCSLPSVTCTFTLTLSFFLSVLLIFCFVLATLAIVFAVLLIIFMLAFIIFLFWSSHTVISLPILQVVLWSW